MTLTLLLDLDDTILKNDIGTFLPSYLHLLSSHMKDYAEPGKLVRALISSTNDMIQNRDGTKTLQEVFEASFYSDLGISTEDVQNDIQEFYRNEFPKLSHLTSIQPGAKELVTKARQKGYKIVLATNPLFPASAIHQRLEWAGFDSANGDFHLIPTFESFHFSKPSIEYYAEILAYLGYPEGPVVMVGDDPGNDIIPASDFGMATFWIKGKNDNSSAREKTSFIGSIDQFISWLDRTDLDEFIPKQNPESQLAVLRATLVEMNRLCGDLNEREWRETKLKGEWCPVEIICHLRDVDSEVNLLRLDTILIQDNPSIRGVDADLWAEERSYKTQNGKQALTSFIRYRQEYVDRLAEISNADWRRTARHSMLGPSKLLELVAITARHDILHIRQLHKMLLS